MSRSFPELPDPPPGHGWPPNVVTAQNRIQEIFEHASSVLNHGGLDGVRLGIQLDRLTNDCIPLLEAMADMPILPELWLCNSVIAVESLIDDLIQAHSAAQGR